MFPDLRHGVSVIVRDRDFWKLANLSRGPFRGHSRLQGLLREHLSKIRESLWFFQKSLVIFIPPWSLPRGHTFWGHLRQKSFISSGPSLPGSSSAPATPAPLRLPQVLASSSIWAGLSTLVFSHHPHLENFVCFGPATSRKIIVELEKHQRRTAKLIKGKARLPSEDRLKRL